MDFPFLLQQFQQELDDLDPNHVNIESIRETDEIAPVLSYPIHTKPGHFHRLKTVCSLLNATSKLSFKDLTEVSLAEMMEIILLALEKIQVSSVNTETGKIVNALTEAAKMLTLELDSFIKETWERFYEYEDELAQVTSQAAELQKKCQMTEISYSLLFDRLKNMENEVKLAYENREEIQLETDHLRDLLLSERKQCQIVSSEFEEIQHEIAVKEKEIDALQRAIRRLNSRKVLNEVRTSDDFAVQEIRSMRRERRNTEILWKGKTANSERTTRGSGTRQLQTLNAMLSDKQKQIKLESTHIKQRERQLDQWEFLLKDRENGIESIQNSTIEKLKSELDSTKKRLFSEQNKVIQLEMTISDLRQSRLDVSMEGYESVKDAEEHCHARERVMTIERLKQVSIEGRRLWRDKFAPKKKAGCCEFC